MAFRKPETGPRLLTNAETIDWGNNLTNRLVAAFPLANEGGRIYRNAAGISAGVSASAATSQFPGPVGHSLKFSASAGERIQTDFKFAPGAGDFAVAFLFYPVSTATNRFDLGAGASIGSGNITFSMAGGLPDVNLNGGWNFGGGTNLSLNLWYHMVVTRKSGTLLMYANGVLIKNWGTISSDVSGSGGNIVFGASDTGGGNPTSNAISNFLFWYRGLDQSEVIALYANPTVVYVAPKRRIASRSSIQAYTLNAESGSYALTGAPAPLLSSRKLAADSGSYALTGVAASLLTGRKLDASPGSYAVSGASAGLIAARKLSADPGSYAVTGASASLLSGRILNAASGSYIITGFDANLVNSGITYTLIAEPGAYTLTGLGAGLTAQRRLSADAGVYQITGSDAGLISARKLTAESGSYIITGVASSLIVGRKLSADPGSYTITGVDASLRAQRIMNAEAGSYAINGFAATLNYSGATVTTFSYAELEAALSSLLVSGSTGATHVFIEGMEREVLNLSHMPLINIRVVESTPEIVSLPNKYYERVQLAIDIIAFDFTSYSAASRIRSALVRDVRDLIVSNRQFYSLLDTTTIGPNVSFGASGTRENNGHIAMATMTVLCEAYVN